MVLVEVDNPLVQLRAALRLVDRLVEQLDVGVESELVHRVDAAHVVEHEEEDRRPLGTRPVALQQEATVMYTPDSQTVRF